MTETIKPKWIASPYLGKQYHVPNLEGLNTEDRKIHQRLANEDGQNRIDATIDKNKTVEVRITEKIIKNKIFYEKYLSGLHKIYHKNKNYKPYNANQEEIKVLIIECFNTKGLTGSFDKSDNNNYERFFLGSTESKSGSNLGRRQLGRHVYMLASKLKGFFALSVENDKKKEFLRGMQWLDKWTNEQGEKMEPYSCFTIPYSNNELQNQKEQFPILDQDVIEEFKELTGTSRKSGETGVSIIIPEPHDGINEEKVYKHYVRRFFPAIINGNLIIRYKNKIINTDNIDKILESENMMSPGWVEFYREVFTRQDKEKHFISSGEDYNYSERLEIVDIAADDIKKIKKDYFSGKPVSLKLGVKIPFNKSNKNNEEISFFNIALKKIEAGDKVVKPLFMRGALQIPNEAKYFLFHKNCHAILWADDDPISEMLGDSEGMAHDSWNMVHTQIQEGYDKKAQLVFKYIKTSLSSIYSFITDKKDEVDFDSFADDLPTIKDIYEEEEKNQQDILFTKEKRLVENPTPPTPTPHAKKMVKEVQIENGFKIVRTEHCEDKNFPMKVRVKFAFRARKKNSFNCFNKDLHFNLIKEKDVSISKKQSIKILKCLENELDFLATDPNFEINITGFKDLEKKDLDVRARKLKD